MGMSVGTASGTNKFTFAHVKQIGITISVPDHGAATPIELRSTAGNKCVWQFDTM